ncbi:RNA ligase/cyclic nucleotide phosphodiesterase [Pseudocohnilembus persalinus]|uniref:RNA ligase/cyclic nucleotide phosphodiesterase n=1 Tax=Pseudocohnilembus persalinus TaxID=266149 RepID=A0A0V0QYR8_PSEPJ|nr:RNA ligase/cyclic nucleotide phosphodiesterase [Pseudocohnilembus persalinus]|eukprot:KRX07414.1 RNA ligase/cyclic nucleotide phosphodiesterase [Pseudocohnilembus persalinus]
MALDSNQYKKQVNDINSKNMISYSGGGWKVMEDEPVCARNEEERKKERERILQQEQKLIQEHMKSQKNEQERKQRFTHFLNLPLNTPILIHQIQELQKQTKLPFLDPRKAHLTLLLLKLNNETLLEKTRQTLAKIVPKLKKIIQNKNQENKLNLKGLGYFGQSAKEARVLFIKINEDKGYEILKEIVDLICKSFIEEEIIEEKDLQYIKFNRATRMYEIEQMHVTLMKTEENGPQSYNVEQIMTQYNDFFDVKNLKFDNLEVSNLDGKVQQDGFYKSLISYSLV